MNRYTIKIKPFVDNYATTDFTSYYVDYFVRTKVKDIVYLKVSGNVNNHMSNLIYDYETDFKG